MKRHPFDPLSFVFGVTFLFFAVALSIPGVDVDPHAWRWIGAGALLVAGAALLLTSVRPDRDRDR